VKLFTPDDQSVCRVCTRVSTAGTRRQAPPGFGNKGEVRYGSMGGLENEVPQSRLYCLCINVALCSMALQCICRVIRRSSMTMKAHTYYIIFGRPSTGGDASPLPAPLAAALNATLIAYLSTYSRRPPRNHVQQYVQVSHVTRSIHTPIHAASRMRRFTTQRTDSQNILRQSYDYLTITPKLRSTCDGRLIYKNIFRRTHDFSRI